METQSKKKLPLNNEQNEGWLILPDCHLIIKYTPVVQNEDATKSIEILPTLSPSREKRFRRSPENSIGGETIPTIAKVQQDLLDLLKQIPVMNEPSVRTKLLPNEYRRHGAWEYIVDMETDLKRILGKNNTPEFLNQVIVAALSHALSKEEEEKLIELRNRLKEIRSTKKNKETIFGIHENRSKLLDLLNLNFNEEGVKTLCFELEIDYDNLPALGKIAKAREFILELERKKRISKLIDLLKRKLPDVSWPPAW